MLYRRFSDSSGARVSSGWYSAHEAMRHIDRCYTEPMEEFLKYAFLRCSLEQTLSVPGHPGPIDLIPESLDDSEVFPGQVDAIMNDPDSCRAHFNEILSHSSDWVQELWPEGRFLLSDMALEAMGYILRDTSLRHIPLKTRDYVFLDFLFHTKHSLIHHYTWPVLADLMTHLVGVRVGDSVVDPACGSGTILSAVARHLQHRLPKGEIPTVYGWDVSSAQMMLANLHLGFTPEVDFRCTWANTLQLPADPEDNPRERLRLPSQYDVVLTSPTGDTLTSFYFQRSWRYQNNEHLEMARTSLAEDNPLIAFSFFFLEQSLKLLKPGGHLGIVLPQQVVLKSSQSIREGQSVIGDLAQLLEVLKLPRELFPEWGTSGEFVYPDDLVLLIFRRYEEYEDRTEEACVGAQKVELSHNHSRSFLEPDECFDERMKSFGDHGVRSIPNGVDRMNPRAHGPYPKRDILVRLGQEERVGDWWAPGPPCPEYVL
ncbi:N-6 DNA methylase [Thioalkalivibrio sp. ALE19]|uniref:N-6 DNA methylase n=1 Tax=Thioalkalivibrio sp. ALE19 TaxID=1266909 RepID=UPI0004259DE1|nr:N-6 DNA methylase [Thioalkalivibrio sp. ALE19]